MYTNVVHTRNNRYIFCSLSLPLSISFVLFCFTIVMVVVIVCYCSYAIIFTINLGFNGRCLASDLCRICNVCVDATSNMGGNNLWCPVANHSYWFIDISNADRNQSLLRLWSIVGEFNHIYWCKCMRFNGKCYDGTCTAACIFRYT